MNSKQSKHFHSISKGCKIVDKDFIDDKRKKIKGAYCKTHKKDICRCGWEWHWHGGEYAFKDETLDK